MSYFIITKPRLQMGFKDKYEVYINLSLIKKIYIYMYIGCDHNEKNERRFTLLVPHC